MGGAGLVDRVARPLKCATRSPTCWAWALVQCQSLTMAYLEYVRSYVTTVHNTRVRYTIASLQRYSTSHVILTADYINTAVFCTYAAVRSRNLACAAQLGLRILS